MQPPVVDTTKTSIEPLHTLTVGCDSDAAPIGDHDGRGDGGDCAAPRSHDERDPA